MKTFKDIKEESLLRFMKKIATSGPSLDNATLYSYFKPLFGKITDEEMFKIAQSCIEFADMIEKKLIRNISLSLMARNLPHELYSNVLYIRDDILLLVDSVRYELIPRKSCLILSFEKGVEFLMTRIPGRNIRWNEYIYLIERMIYLVLVLEFKLNNIKISNHIFYGAYVDYWPTILAHCNQQGFYNSWNWTFVLSGLITKTLTKELDILLRGDEKGSTDIGIAEITLRFVKVYLHLYNHFHSENRYMACPIKPLLSKSRESIYQSLIKSRPNQNPYFMLIAKKFRTCIVEPRPDGISNFFRFFRDDLFILSLQNTYWKPWMRSYSRYIVNQKTQLVEIFEEKEKDFSFGSTSKSFSFSFSSEEDPKEIEVDPKEIEVDPKEIEVDPLAEVFEEIEAAELLLASNIIQKMRQWANRAKQELLNLAKVSSLPVWDKKRLETEIRSLFRKSHFNLDPNILEKYLEKSLTLLSRIQADLVDIDTCLRALEFEKVKQQFPNVHEDIDHLHEYKDLLVDQERLISLTKSLLQSDFKMEIDKAWKSLNTYTDSHDSQKRIKSLVDQINGIIKIRFLVIKQV